MPISEIGMEGYFVIQTTLETIRSRRISARFDLLEGNDELKAYAWPVLGEISIEDNAKVYGTIYVYIAGDINNDCWINAKDAIILGVAF